MLVTSPRSDQRGESSGYSQSRRSILVWSTLADTRKVSQSWQILQASLRHQAFRNLSPSSRMQNLAHLGAGFSDPILVAKSTETLSCSPGVYEIVLNGKLQLALPDNQASANIMSLKFAVIERIKMDRVKIPFTFGDGSVHYSIGRATADCALQSSPHSTRAYQFYIFLDLIEPIILGRKFLHDAGLSRYPKRLSRQLLPDEDDADARSVWTTRSLDQIEYSSWQIRVVLRYGSTVKDIGVVCDRGSDINVMSLAYAQEIGIDIRWSQRHQESVCLADGSATEILGFIYASIRFYGQAGRLGLIQLRFVLIDSLPFHVAIGNPFIKQCRIFEDMHDFDWTFTDDEEALLCMMRLASKWKKGNSNPGSAPFFLEFWD